jgi:hypothetical protein
MRSFLVLAALFAMALPTVACCGQPNSMPALVIRSPVGLQQETAPGQVRMVPAYSTPTWSAPAVQAPAWAAPGCAPSYAPAANPCAPISDIGHPPAVGLEPTAPARREMALLAVK